eukprot:4700833-Prymnesium_polylepis.2
MVPRAVLKITSRQRSSEAPIMLPFPDWLWMPTQWTAPSPSPLRAAPDALGAIPAMAPKRTMYWLGRTSSGVEGASWNSSRRVGNAARRAASIGEHRRPSTGRNSGACARSLASTKRCATAGR